MANSGFVAGFSGLKKSGKITWLGKAAVNSSVWALGTQLKKQKSTKAHQKVPKMDLPNLACSSQASKSEALREPCAWCLLFL